MPPEAVDTPTMSAAAPPAQFMVSRSTRSPVEEPHSTQASRPVSECRPLASSCALKEGPMPARGEEEQAVGGT